MTSRLGRSNWKNGVAKTEREQTVREGRSVIVKREGGSLQREEVRDCHVGEKESEWTRKMQ